MVSSPLRHNSVGVFDRAQAHQRSYIYLRLPPTSLHTVNAHSCRELLAENTSRETFSQPKGDGLVQNAFQFWHSP